MKQNNPTQSNLHPNQRPATKPLVKPLVHWAIYKKYTLRFKKRAENQVTGILNTPSGTQDFSYDPSAMSIHLPDEIIHINEHGWELDKIPRTKLEAGVTNFQSLIRQLEQAFQQDLPGKAAQYQMAPKPRPEIEMVGEKIEQSKQTGYRTGGVLVLFYLHEQQPHIPLILRQSYEGVHSGQISFPGGGHEENDKDITSTALREAHEEIGIDPAQVHLLGQLTPLYIAPSNYLVHATVGWSKERPDFKLDPHEVDRLIELPLTELLDPTNQKEEQWTLRDREANVPFFAVQNQTIWGATAMLLNELINLPTIQK